MSLIIGIVIIVIMAFIAYKKGFNPVFWILSGGVIGLVVVLCLPSANAAGIDDMEKEKRRKRGNTVGAVLSVIGIIIMIVVLLFALRIIR